MRVTTHLDTENGHRLRQARLVNNLTQADLAQRVGISFQQIQKYENGSNRISSSRLYQTARVLGLPVTYFFDNLAAGTVDTTAPAIDQALPDRAIRTARALDQIPDGLVKDHLFALIKSVSKNPVSSPAATGQPAKILPLRKARG